MKSLQRSLRLSVFVCFLFCLFLLSFYSSKSYAVTVNSLGDYDNIAVLEVAGDYSSLDESGKLNVSARHDVSREFFRNHGDDYDFLVTFSTFDFPLPAPGVKAYLLPSRNNVEGIGLDLYDSTNLFSADGEFQERLEGLIEMGPVSSHVLEPSHPEFEKTLQAMTHEMVHQWAAYLSYMEAGEVKDDLLGAGQSHWSFLLDSAGSTLYGNHWQDNGDGTFTTIAPDESLEGSFLGRVLSPLELYLMGVGDRSAVPPLTLIESPGMDPERLPEVGVTIPGVAKTITIDQITAAMGERYPAVHENKEFRMAFLLLVEPGSWIEGDTESMRLLDQLGYLQKEWQQRFSILTDGAATLQTKLSQTSSSNGNPGVASEVSVPHVSPHVNEGVNWLLARQEAEGSWKDLPGTAQRDTAAAVSALQSFFPAHTSVVSGRLWLESLVPHNNDFAARILLGAGGNSDELVSRQNSDGGWGSDSGYRSNPYDTALVLFALVSRGFSDPFVIDMAVSYLYGTQRPDSGWNNGHGQSSVMATAYALLALNECRNLPDPILEQSISKAILFLSQHQNADGGFGEPTSTSYDTALALLALKAAGAATNLIDSSVNYLLSNQGSTGSWGHSVFQTALAVKALYACSVQTDLSVTEADISLDPADIVAIPTEATLSAQIWNSGEKDVQDVSVVLYQGPPIEGALLGQVEVSVPKHSSIKAEFPLQINHSGDVVYSVVVDSQGLVDEASEYNNQASRAFTLGQTPTVGFAFSEASGTETIGVAQLEVLLSHSWDKPVSVDVAISQESTAVNGSDYSVTPETITFQPGETVKLINLNILNDTIPEDDETILLQLSNPVNASLENATTSYTIVNDDLPPVIGFSVETDAGDESLGVVAIGVTLSRSYPVDVSVSYALDAAACSATASEDFLLSAGTLIVQAGETSALMTMTIVDDLLEEADEEVVVRLSSPSGASLGAEAFSFTILDNDALPYLNITSPEEGAVYSSRQPNLDYETNITQDRIEVFVDGEPVVTRNGDLMQVLSNGEHSIRIVVTNPNQVTVEETIHFVVDDTAQEPSAVWTQVLQEEGAGSKNYRCLQHSSDNAIYAVYDEAYSPPKVRKLDHTGRLQWSGYVPEPQYTYNYCRDSAVTDEAYVILDSSAIRWYSDQAVIMGAQGHNISLPVYQASSWQFFALSPEENIYVAGKTEEGMSKSDIEDAGNIQLARVDLLGQVLWRNVIATTLTDSVNDVLADSAGNLYLLGTTSGYLGQVGGGNAGGTDLFLVKYDSLGTELWRRQWGTAQNDSGGQLAVDGNGDVIAVGTTYGSFDGVGPTLDSDAFIVKASPDGDELWIQQDHEISSGQRLAVTPEDDIVIAGYFGRPKSGYNVNMNVRWSRYSSGGDKLWNSAVPTGSLSYNESVTGLLVDPFGNLFVAATYLFENYSTMKWESRAVFAKYNTGYDVAPPMLTLAPYGYDHLTSSITLEGRKEYLSRLSVTVDDVLWSPVQTSDASTTWSAAIGELSAGQHAVVIEAVDPDGNIARRELVLDIPASINYGHDQTTQHGTEDDEELLASVLSDTGQLFLAGKIGVAGSSSSDVALWRADSSHNVMPLAEIDASVLDSGKDIALDADGFVYIAWETFSDAYVSKLDSVGNILWTGEFSSRKGTQHVEAVAVDNTGNVFITGYTSDSPERGVDHGGGQDYFLVKFDSSGSFLWSKLTGPGHPGDQAAYDLGIDDYGNVYIAGYSQGPLHGEPSLYSAFVAKFDNNGVRQWVDVVEEDRPGVINSLVLDADSIYLYGEVNEFTGGGKDFLLVKYSTDGTMLWSQSEGGRLDDYARDIALMSDGTVLVAGLSTTSPAYNVFENDIVWSRYDSEGKRLWRDRIHAAQSDDISGIHGTSDGGVLIAGKTDRVMGEVSYGSFDLFLMEFSLISGPELAINPVASPTSQQEMTLSGQTTPGASITIEAGEQAMPSLAIGPINMDPENGDWSCQVAGLKPNVSNSFIVIASNSYGTTRVPVSIFVDQTPPILVVNSVESPTDQPVQIITGYVEPGASLFVDVETAGVSFPVAVNEDGVWQYDAVLQAGENQLGFTATDAVGNQAAVSIIIAAILPEPVDISLSKATISRDEATDVILTIANAAPGREYFIEEYLDANGDGIVNIEEPLVRSFVLKDEFSSNDLNLPSDEALLANQPVENLIVTTLNYHYVGDIYHAAGKHLFRISDGQFDETVSLFVAADSYSQVVRGFVADEIGVGVPGAIVRARDKWGRTVGYAFSSSSGEYSLGMKEPGTYFFTPFAAEMVCDKNLNVEVVVEAGGMVNKDLALAGVSNRQSGTVLGSSMSQPLSGVLVRAENDRYIAVGRTDLSGSYRLALPDGDYDISMDSFSVEGGAGLALYTSDKPLLTTSASDGAHIEEIILDSYQPVCSWTARDPVGEPVPGVPVKVLANDETGTVMNALSDGYGQFSVASGLSQEAWCGEVSLNDEAAQLAGYVGTQFTFAPGDCTSRNLTVYPVEASVSGRVASSLGNPLGQVPVVLRNALSGAVARGLTASDGTYHLGVHTGEWSVTVDASGYGVNDVLSKQVIVDFSQAELVDFKIDIPLPNTLAVTEATYSLRKQTLTVSATSDYPNASLAVEYSGIVAPMQFERLFKGKYRWSLVATDVQVAPESVLVVGPEGSITFNVTVR